MAKHLARIHGTEEDKVNCPFYFKIGACRHSDRCSRLHHKPAFSPTILIKHLYRHPKRLAELKQAGGGGPVEVNQAKAQEDFMCFYEDLFLELSTFGPIDALHVCDNLGDHMIGHVYVKFQEEEDASDALHGLQGRWYDGRKMEVEFSPVTDFREARCRDFDEETCSRGGFCNFLHAKPIPYPLMRSLQEDGEEGRRRAEEAKHRQEKEDRRERRRAKKRHRKDEGESSSKRSRRSRRGRSRSHSDDDGDLSDRS